MRNIDHCPKMTLFALSACIFMGCETPWTAHSSPLAPAPSSQTWANAHNGANQVTVNYSPQYSRVDQMGRRLLEANPELGIKPLFYVPETPDPEIFHDGEFRLFISQGLVDQCRTDGQLAAVLSMELARMAGDKDVRMQVWDSHGAVVGRSAPIGSEPPPEVRIGPDGGSFGEADQYRKAELAKLGYDRRSPSKVSSADQGMMAREFLARAGFAEEELDAVAPLLRSAGKHNALERQFRKES